MRNFQKSDLIFYLIICIIGLMHLPYPFFGDQAFFNLGAQHMHRGDILYKDFWDIKQPGIFFFYYLGGVLFKFTESGIHLFELLYWLLFTFITITVFRHLNILKNSGLIPLLPTIIIVLYYLNAGTGKLTQVEALVNFPLSLVLFLSYLATTRTSNRETLFFISGIAGGLVLYFKLIFLPIIGAIWLIVLVHEIFNSKLNLKSLLSYVMIPLGMLISFVPFIIYVLHNDMLRLVLNTFFVYPVQIVSTVDTQKTIVLVEAIKNFTLRIAPIIPLAIVGLIYHRNKLLIKGTIAWLLSGIFVILIQKTSWYGYHFQLLYVPLGISFIFGLDILWRDVLNLIIKKVQGRYFQYFLKIAIVSCFIFPSFGFLTYKSIYLIQNNLALNHETKVEFIQSIDKFNTAAIEESKFLLQDTAKQGDIYIIGDPLIYYYSHRFQAVALNVWAPHLISDELWCELHDQLEENKPVYFFIDSFFEPIMQKNGTAVYNFLDEYYTVFRTNNRGIWYELNNSCIAVF